MRRVPLAVPVVLSNEKRSPRSGGVCPSERPTTLGNKRSTW